MKIAQITAEPLSIPLKKPFVTALRQANAVENVLITIMASSGDTGYGEVSPVAMLTGETPASVMNIVHGTMAIELIGRDIDAPDEAMLCIHRSMHGNTAAKSAVECALYDLFARQYHMPLFRLLGGIGAALETDITISSGSVENMSADCREALSNGYRFLKLKTGKNAPSDSRTVIALWQEIQQQYPERDIKLRIDANQGWSVKEAVNIIRTWEDAGVPIEWVEQPVVAWDLEGMKTVVAHTGTLIMADESIYSPRDALRVLEARAADLINIKLAKAGGIRHALDIAAIARTYGVECMMGCMLEGRLGASAAAHVAASQSNITRVDLDGPELCLTDPFTDGPVFDRHAIIFTDDAGIGTKPEDKNRLLTAGTTQMNCIPLKQQNPRTAERVVTD